MNQARLARVLRNMERDGLTQIVISSTASVYYLTGYWVEPMERMLALYIRADGTCRLFANALFALEPQEGLELVLHQDSDEPTAALAAALLPGTLGVDKAWPSKFLIALLAARPDVTPVLGSGPVDDARMYKDADERLAELREQNELAGAMFKMKNDPRVTKIGKFIRKHSIDEFPQFLNVFMGQMSVVGPRPPLPNEVAEYTEYDLQRLAVKPGITGWWQVTDRNDTDFDGMVRRDLEYIAKRGPITDLKIVLLTVVEVFTGGGAC